MNNGPPFFYDYANQYINREMPSTVHVKNTALSRYFQRYLLQKIMSVFEWKMPATWDEAYFKYVLYCWGWIAIINTDKWGVICQQCGLRGYDVFYRPTNAIITNPLIRRTLEPRIGVQCTLIKLQPNYSGVMDIVTYYADMFALIAEAVAVTALNAKNAYIFTAEDKQSAQSIKKMYDGLSSGEPAIVINKKLVDPATGELKMQMLGDGKQTTVINDMLLAFNTLETYFDRDIGLPAMPYTRKERNLQIEVNNSSISTVSKIGMWLQELKKTCTEARQMFGIELDVEWRNPPQEGGRANAGDNEPGRNANVVS